jgi:hypothetical protein
MLFTVGAWVCGSAQAHKASDAYLQLRFSPGQVIGRWDIALRDLDVALDIDRNGDGQLSWGEVREAWPRIEAYAMARLSVRACTLRSSGRSLERRSDGAYAVLDLAAECSPGADPVLGYALFAEVDPTHRGIAKIERPGQALQLLVLEPHAFPVSGPAVVEALPGTATAAPPSARWPFVVEGVHHILTGYDHVLFLLCLMLPAVLRRNARGWRAVDTLGEAIWPVVGIVSAFTVAHTITLALAALKLVALPSAFIEPAIALTIVLAAVDNLWPLFPVRRVVVTFAFGLVHGFGFASVLSELNLPATDFVWALLQFNLGLELGQLLIVACAVAALFGVRRWAGYPRVVLGGGSLLAMGIAALWFIERTVHIGILPG